MLVFYDWPFPHMCTLQVFAFFNSWLSFQRLCRLLWGYIYYATIRGEINKDYHKAPYKCSVYLLLQTAIFLPCSLPSFLPAPLPYAALVCLYRFKDGFGTVVENTVFSML